MSTPEQARRELAKAIMDTPPSVWHNKPDAVVAAIEALIDAKLAERQSCERCGNAGCEWCGRVEADLRRAKSALVRNGIEEMIVEPPRDPA